MLRGDIPRLCTWMGLKERRIRCRERIGNSQLALLAWRRPIQLELIQIINHSPNLSVTVAVVLVSLTEQTCDETRCLFFRLLH